MTTSQFHIKIDSIRHRVDAQAYGLGEQYAVSGVVFRVTRRGDLLLGFVTGDTVEPYEVVIHLQDGEPIKATCTCPFDWGTWCKHKVAVAIFAANRPDSVLVAQDLPELLAAFVTRQDLADLIAHLVDHTPRLMGAIDAYSVSCELLPMGWCKRTKYLNPSSLWMLARSMQKFRLNWIVNLTPARLHSRSSPRP